MGSSAARDLSTAFLTVSSRICLIDIVFVGIYSTTKRWASAQYVLRKQRGLSRLPKESCRTFTECGVPDKADKSVSQQRSFAQELKAYLEIDEAGW